MANHGGKMGVEWCSTKHCFGHKMRLGHLGVKKSFEHPVNGFRARV